MPRLSNTHSRWLNDYQLLFRVKIYDVDHDYYMTRDKDQIFNVNLGKNCLEGQWPMRE